MIDLYLRSKNTNTKICTSYYGTIHDCFLTDAALTGLFQSPVRAAYANNLLNDYRTAYAEILQSAIFIINNLICNTLEFEFNHSDMHKPIETIVLREHIENLRNKYSGGLSPKNFKIY